MKASMKAMARRIPALLQQRRRRRACGRQWPIAASVMRRHRALLRTPGSA